MQVVPAVPNVRESVDLQQANQVKFQEMPSIAHRFEDKSGLELHIAVDELYLVEDSVTVGYFGTAGEELLSRSPYNDRNEEVTVAAYEEKIYEKGVMQFFRGQPCIMPNGPRDAQKFHLLTNGSLTTALYKANKRRPFNRQVQLSVEQGLMNCKMYHARTPKDVCEWLIEAHNDFHQGS